MIQIRQSQCKYVLGMMWLSVTHDHTLVIEVESTLATTTCRQCGQEISQFHGYSKPKVVVV